MAPGGYQRKIAAILSADVAGYSRLMGENEEETVLTLKAYREVMGTLISEHRGRVVDSPGDNLLAEFSSVVDALRSAWDIQKEIAARNSGLPEGRRMVFRMGINLGDVIEEEGRIYGDGVNVAERMESLAGSGGISISETAHDQVKNKLPCQYEYQGEQAVKNIAEPVRVYRVVMEPRAEITKVSEKRVSGLRKWGWAGIGAFVILILGAITVAVWHSYFSREPQPDKATVAWALKLELPDKPSIAVLPFVNMSGDPGQEYFSDGISEDIITALSKVPKLFVIARHSTFTYKGKPIWVPTVGKELGVRYVLEGSVRRAGDKVRVTAQLIDAMTNQHLWAERYDRDLKDIFAVQDEITKKVVTALQVKLTEGEQARVYSRGTNNLEAYLTLLKGREQMNRLNKEGNALARQTIEHALALDPQYPFAYLLLAISHNRDVILRSTNTPKKSIAKSIEMAQMAIALDESSAEAHGFLAFLLGVTGKHDEAVAQGERAVTLNPNSADAQFWFAQALNYSAGKHEEAIPVFKKAIRLNPIPPLNYLMWLAIACRDAGRYEEAIAVCRNILQKEPDFIFAHTCLASCFALMDRETEARSEAAEVVRIDPKFSVNYTVSICPYKYDADRNRLREALLKAGLPE